LFASPLGNIKGRVDFALTQDIERDLSPETPLNQRTKVMKELSEAVLKNRLEDVRASSGICSTVLVENFIK
jgi:hypothetical protein